MRSAFRQPHFVASGDVLSGSARSSATLPTREYIPYMKAFRGVAIALIILTHISTPRWLYDLVHNATVFFLFLSGFLFSHLHIPKESTWSFWCRNFTRLIPPYLCAALAGIIYISITRVKPVDINYSIRTFVTGTGHLNDVHWYVPLIVLLFAMYPLLRVLQQRQMALLSLTACWLVVGAFSFRSAGNANPWFSVLHFGGVFLAGMAASRYRAPLEEIGARLFWIIVPCSVAIFAITLPSVHVSQSLNMETVMANRVVAADFAFIGKIAIIPAVLLVLKRMTDAEWTLRPLTFLADRSLGLFFWHLYLVNMLNLHVPNHQIPGVLAGPFIFAQFTVILGVVSCALYLARKMLGPRIVFLTGVSEC